MAQKFDLLKSAKEKAAQAGALISDKAEEARDIAAQAGEIISDKASEAMDKAAQAGEHLSDMAAEAKYEFDLRRFRPITEEQLAYSIDNMPDIVNVVETDKRTDEEVCKNAVAFDDGNDEMRVVSILEKNVGLLNSTFYPYVQESIYFRDPCNPSVYIDVNEYFDYIKKAKVHELNQIAQSLGANHVKITLKAEKKYFVQNKAKGGAAVGKDQKVDATHSDSDKQFVSIEVASDKKYKGHEAKKPALKYFKYDPDIQNIIDRRMNKDNPIYSDIETIKYNYSSGIKKNDVAKIEGVLKKLKVKGNASISSEVENEERLYFEYQIEYPSE